MKTTTKFIYSGFAAFVPIPLVLAFVALAISASTANGAPGDLIAPDGNGNIFQVSIYPSGGFGTASFVWNNANLTPHGWVGAAFDRAGNLYVSEEPGCINCGSIYKLSPDRTTLTLFATGLNPAALAVDTAGNIYEPEADGVVYRFDPETAVRSTFAMIQSDDPFNFGNMAFDSQGNLFYHLRSVRRAGSAAYRENLQNYSGRTGEPIC